MSTPNDDAARLAEIRSRCDKCREWKPTECGIGKDGYVPECSSIGETLIYLGDNYEGYREDWAFIAHSCEDIPWLLSLLDAQQVEVERLREALQAISRHPVGTVVGPCGCGMCESMKQAAQAALTPADGCPTKEAIK